MDGSTWNKSVWGKWVSAPRRDDYEEKIPVAVESRVGKPERQKARRLSEGARQGKWMRSQVGVQKMSRAHRTVFFLLTHPSNRPDNWRRCQAVSQSFSTLEFCPVRSWLTWSEPWHDDDNQPKQQNGRGSLHLSSTALIARRAGMRFQERERPWNEECKWAVKKAEMGWWSRWSSGWEMHLQSTKREKNIQQGRKKALIIFSADLRLAYRGDVIPSFIATRAIAILSYLEGYVDKPWASPAGGRIKMAIRLTNAL